MTGKDKHNYFPNNTSSETLTILRDIKLTSREIDIMACILHMRGTSKIASLLSIALRTVETHVLNIMRKTGCHSREGIIDFIEKSGKTSLFRKHYQNLLIQTEFQKQLKEIFTFLRSKAPPCCISYGCDQEDQKPLLHILEKHLTLAGIKPLLEKRNEEENFNILSLYEDHTMYIIYVISGSFLEQFQSNKDKEKLALSLKNHKTLTFLLLDSAPLEIPQEVREKGCIRLSDQENYYELFFELLKRIVPNLALDPLILDFKNTLNTIWDSEKPSTLSLKEEDKEDLDVPNASMTSPLKQNQETSLEVSKKKSNKKKLNLRVAFLSLTLVSMLGWLLYQRLEDSLSFPSIQSPLAIPARDILLPREELMNALHQSLKKDGDIRVVALVGMGGSGKTTLARWYARQQKVPIVWEINSETSLSLMASFESLAEALACTEDDQRTLRTLKEPQPLQAREKALVNFVRERLKQNKEWMLIFDNVGQWSDLQNFFPHNVKTWGKGRVIITTRDATIQNQKQVQQMIPVGTLHDQEKQKLFFSIMGSSSSWSSYQLRQAQGFLSQIPPFPLDISTAAYYLRATEASYESYLTSIHQTSPQFEEMQERLLKEAGDYSQTRYGIISTSLEKILKAHQKASSLLLLISLIDSQNIPRALLASSVGETEIDRLIYYLKKYSLLTSTSLSFDKTPSTFSLHRSTQMAMRAFFFHQEDTFQLLKSGVSILEKFMEVTLDHEDFSRMKIILPHAEAFLKNASSILTDPQKGTILCATGCIYALLEQEQKAESILKQGLEYIHTKSMEKDRWQARTLLMLGESLWRLGDYDNAKKALQKSLDLYTQKKDLEGKGRVLTALGTLYNALGESAQSRFALEESVGLHRLFPKNLTGLAQTLRYLGFFYKNHALYEQSLQCLEESLAIYQKLPENYLGKSIALSYLADSYRELGRYDQAQEYLEKSLFLLRKNFNNHRMEAWGLCILGEVFTERGNYPKAQEFFKKSWEIYKKNFTSNNFYEPRVLENIGNTYLAMGEYEQAHLFLEKSNTMCQKVYPEGSIGTSWVWPSLANLLQEKGEYRKAQQLLEKTLVFHTSRVAEDHIYILGLKVQLGTIHRDLGNLTQSRILLQKGLHIYEQHYGKDHTKIAHVLRHFGLLALKESNTNQAEERIQKALNIFQKHKHPSEFLCWENLSDIYFAQASTAHQTKDTIHHQKNAMKAIQEALRIATATFSSHSAHIQRLQRKLNNYRGSLLFPDKPLNTNRTK